jgi:hypothetical protein
MRTLHTCTALVDLKDSFRPSRAAKKSLASTVVASYCLVLSFQLKHRLWGGLKGFTGAAGAGCLAGSGLVGTGAGVGGAVGVLGGRVTALGGSMAGTGAGAGSAT